MFNSIIDPAGLSLKTALICTGVSLVLGFIISLTYIFSGKCSKSFAVTLTVLPAVVQAVIMLVNGSLGVGVAIVGAFSLVRFRSVPGTSKEICIIFFAMAAGLSVGTGYIGYAFLITLIICAVFLLLTRSKFAEGNTDERILKITIPESLDYSGVFDDIFESSLSSCRLDRVKTTNLGSMYELSYTVTLKSGEKELIDEIRKRNGNLTVSLSRSLPQTEVL